MAVKSLRIDQDAYDRLKSEKHEDESFSDVVKRLLPKPFDLKAWLKMIDTNHRADEPAECVECVVTPPHGKSARRRV
ncbi:MAG: antitoxin VapB family protein [Burkholderiales bacterium]|nr:antitoxin VapB family protein [Phycisphaerae bacterium]